MSNATDRGLCVNPEKTKENKPPIFRPLKLNGTELKLKQEAHFLGLILDRKLSWKSNIIKRIEKAFTALCACNRVLGWKCGLRPRIYLLDLDSGGQTYLDIRMPSLVGIPF